MENVISIHKEIQTLADELEGLRRRLENETSAATKLREAYDSECRRVPVEDVKLVAAKLRFDAATAGIDRIKAEITEKESVVDEVQGHEIDERRRELLEEAYENATKQLSESKSKVDNLRAEYISMRDKIRLAEWQFHQALRNFNEAKSRVAGSVGT